LTKIFEIILAIFYLFGASTGYMVLRFTDNSEALIIVALIILIHEVLSQISNLLNNWFLSNLFFLINPCTCNGYNNR